MVLNCCNWDYHSINVVITCYNLYITDLSLVNYHNCEDLTITCEVYGFLYDLAGFTLSNSSQSLSLPVFALHVGLPAAHMVPVMFCPSKQPLCRSAGFIFDPLTSSPSSAVEPQQEA